MAHVHASLLMIVVVEQLSVASSLYLCYVNEQIMKLQEKLIYAPLV